MIRIREFLAYEYKDPAAWLRALGEIEPLLVGTRLPYEVLSLRTHKLRQWQESRQAALFAYGMSRRMSDFVFDVAHVEHADYDAIVRTRRGNDQCFTPIQLKEYVPAHVNKRATLDEIFHKLAALGDSPDLVVAIHLNRRFKLETNRPPPLKLGGLYFFGAAVPDKSTWFLIGDLLKKENTVSAFAYPR